MLKILIRQNQIDLDSTIELRSLEIQYSGEFVGEVLGNAFVNMTRSKMSINYIDAPNNTIMIYYGEMRIKRIIGVDNNKDTHYAQMSSKSDVWNQINGTWGKAGKWNDYKEIVGHGVPIKSLLRYTFNNSVAYTSSKGAVRLNKEIIENKRLKSIRSKYGVK